MRKTSYAIALSVLLFFANLSSAQTSTIAVSPTQLTFNTNGNTATPAQNLLITSTNFSTTAAFTVSSFSSGSWLSVTPASGNTPQVLSVSVNPGAMATGAYAGFITVTSGSSSITVPVILNVNSGGTSTFQIAPGSLTFNFQTGSNVPQSQQINVSAAGGANVTFSATTATSNGAGWLSVNPNSGATPNAILNVSVNPSNLQAGIYFGAVAINAPGTTGLIVPVQVAVAPPPSINVAPAQLSFAYQIGTTAPAAQTLNITGTGGGTIAFTATPTTTSCGNWLVVSPQSSATPAAVSVQINTVALQPNNCTGSITISAPGASNPTQSIPVSLLVSTNPLLQVSATLPFTYQTGTGLPASQTVQVTSSSTPLAFTVAATPVSGGPNFLTVSPTTGTTPQAITLSLNAAVLAGLAPNTYAENVTVASAGAGNPPQTFTVTLVVSNNATLVLSQPSVTFNYQIGQASPPNQTVTLSSTGPPLPFAVTTSTANCSGFLNALPPTFGVTASQPGQQTQLVLNVNTTGLTTPQTCTGTVTVLVPGSANPPLNIAATLNVSATALLNVSPSAVNVAAVAGSTGVMIQPISLTSTDGTALNISATAVTNPPGLTWLSVVPQTGATPLSLNVMVNPSGLQFGTYTGSIQIASSSPNVPSQSVPVTLNVASGTIAVTPTSLTFTQPLGGTLPGTQTVQVTGIPAGATVGAAASMLNGAGWLNASISGTTITVSANGSALTQGTYAGVITVIVPGASNSPLYVPVTFTVGGAPLFTVTPSTVSFTYQQSTTLPPSQTVQLASSGNLQFNAVTVAGTAGGPIFITVTPSSGTTPANVSVSLNQSVVAALLPGTYTDTINLSSSLTGPSQPVIVTLILTPPPLPAINAVVNSASLLPGPVSPGEIFTIFGLNIGPASPVGLRLNSNGLVATTLGTTSVTFNNVAAPLIYVSANQINAIVPYEVAGSATANVVVSNNGAMSATFQVNVTTASPAIFTFGQNGTGQGAILNQDLSINGPANPAARGSVIAIYGTGEGVVTPAVLTGSVTTTTPPIPKPILPVTVSIGGVPAVVNYGGEAPALVAGVLQVNAVVPANVAVGNQTLIVSVGGIASPAVVTVAVK